MKSLSDISIRHKQMVIIILTSVVALLTACVAFVAYDVVSFRSQMVERATVLAKVIGNNCTAAIDFNDPRSAKETLEGLRAEPGIVGACVYDAKGQLFAVYRRDDAVAFHPPPVQRSAYRFHNGALLMFCPITLKGERIGTVFLQSDLSQLYRRLDRYPGIVGLMLAVALLAALLLSSRLQHIVCDPILQLAGVARAVALDKNYSLRVTKRNNDELGQLIDGFNEMLAQIQARDTALQTARDHLEQRVQERTAELANSLSLLNATLESTADGILALDRSGKVLSYNAKFAAIWGLSDQLPEHGNTVELGAQVAHQLKNPEAFLDMVRESVAHPEATSFDVIELKDGRVFERYALPQRIDDRCVGVVINWRDITERRRAHEELAREQARLKLIFDSVPVGISLAKNAPDGRLLERHINDAHLRICGLTREQDADLDIYRRITHPDDHRRQTELFQQAMKNGAGQYSLEKRYLRLDGKTVWVLFSFQRRVQPDGAYEDLCTVADITESKQAQEEREKLNLQLLDASRQAGMAEVATSVLHNVGNVLNSVNVSASVVMDQLRASAAPRLSRVSKLLEEHRGDLAAYLSANDTAGKLVSYLNAVAAHHEQERTRALAELQELTRNIEHIKEIVAMQQSYAKVSGVAEYHSIAGLLDDALRLNQATLANNHIAVARGVDSMPDLLLDKHKVLQILVNLISNAKYALSEAPGERKLTLHAALCDNNRLRISVADNGVGIARENLARIFSHGFTTRKTGHGFGLHGGALAAKEMGGSLQVQSDGPGKGATFTLELPAHAKR